jgi:hypothetical protein
MVLIAAPSQIRSPRAPTSNAPPPRHLDAIAASRRPTITSFVLDAEQQRVVGYQALTAASMTRDAAERKQASVCWYRRTPRS